MVKVSRRADEKRLAISGWDLIQECSILADQVGVSRERADVACRAQEESSDAAESALANG
jgi:hypothetical protein